ncbi:GNAT family N-acetyltransferase [Telluribacter sp.]|jgi:predicted GNAT superfamily acetyltransferase|uniref:GNAT family N-acetyltransferase n=1 Tax=Telluribacter sp. TaxID=1978767 RepID=UPI002E151225|nr:GNAT family N-acetyltransferase [Telluribacter sp.]
MIRYVAQEGPLSPDSTNELLRLHFQIFTGDTREALAEEIARADSLFTLLAYDDQQLIGYKMGYRRKPGHFYSWLGGVLAAYRKQGIASGLMVRQHAWCQQRGYHTIRTQTMNRWRAMLILNLRHGFDIVGLIAPAEGEPKIVLEKKL